MPVSIDERLWPPLKGSDESRPSDDAAKSSMAALVARVVGAKPFPETARRLADMTRMPHARISNAVRILETDPGLSARLLRLVNSPGYALRMRCTSLRHAAALVGLERLNHISTTAAVLDMFGDNTEVSARILDHSTVVGAFCRYFAVSFSLPAEELFTCGFLHDIGKLFLLEAEGDAYAALLSQSSSDSHERERELYGFDHANLGAHVLDAWNIPDPVPLIVAWHHSRSLFEGPPEISAMIETLRLSDEIAELMGSVSDGRAIRRIAESEAAQRLNLGEQQLTEIWPELRTLRSHCRAQRNNNETKFVDVTSIRPSASLPPPSAPPQSSKRPDQLCGICSEPGPSSTCSACDDNVCAKHLHAPDGWCDRCMADFATTRGALGIGLPLTLGITAAFASLLLGAVFGAVENGVPQTLRVLLAPVLALGLSAVFLGTGQRWIVRGRFLKQRKRRERESLAEPEAPSPAELREARLTTRIPGVPAVLSVPPSAFDDPSLRSLPQHPLPPPARAALLGSSPPPAQLAPEPLRSVLSEPPPYVPTLAPAAPPAAELPSPLPLAAALAPPAPARVERLPAEAPRAVFLAATRMPRRGRRLDRGQRRRDS
jgi:HD-like signal output (HDOD) protein